MTVKTYLYDNFCFLLSGDRKVVIFRGAKSYPGYRGNHRIQETAPTNRRVDISKVQLYGARRNDPTYRQGLEDLAGLIVVINILLVINTDVNVQYSSWI
ncbi:hypothetical protein MN116_007966 [Schistosoma mekongi]|uniref:Uncharacterized protein n=1 Tax=Schistosoma mekongi TaxID=38744 RepID=A0AAE1Z725_SCHME|nr:hypothetical protein MN116_007966 [Schistosoma mekongi]